METPALDALLSRGTVRAYDKAAVEAFLAAADEERTRLRAAIAAAEARTAEARDLQASKLPDALDPDVQERILAAQRTYVSRRRSTQHEIEEIARMAEATATAALAAARTEVELLHAAAAALGGDGPGAKGNVIDLRAEDDVPVSHS